MSQTEARRFEFTTEARSYGQALGKTANLGVISAVFYKERVPIVMPGTSNDYAARQAPAPRLSSPLEQEAREGAAGDAAPHASAKSAPPPAADNEYAATGMGRLTGHTIA